MTTNKPTRAPSMLADKTKPNTGGWQDQHDAAVNGCLGVMTVPSYGKEEFEFAIVRALDAWFDYASGHKRRYGFPIGEDHILGPHWRAWGLALRGLLNGETGRLDCGTLDAFILANLEANGVRTKDL